jgi:hypothetical protein
MELRKYIVDYLEKMMRFLYGWMATNDESLGKITYAVHLFCLVFIIILIFLSHTIYPVIWFQFITFLIVLIVWIQHIILKICVCSVLEIKLMGREAPLAIDVILGLFKLPVSKETRMGVTLLMSTMGMLFLGLELISRSVMYFREINKFSLWA